MTTPNQPEPTDNLDSLLREWHDKNAARAMAGRDRLLSELQRAKGPAAHAAASPRAALLLPGAKRWWSATPFRITAAAAAIALVAGIAFLAMPPSKTLADANLIYTADGGRLDAFDNGGTLIGPCPLKHTDVRVDTSGLFARVTLVQRFHNTYTSKIEAVYTFPLSARGAVDRMQISIGNRQVIGEVRERGEARELYETARKAGFVAGLLEQSRPNIFTQSVANIESGADVLVEISYIETLRVKDGLYNFDFPMVVSPRYVPGADTGAPLPAGLRPRNGLVLLAPIQHIRPSGAGNAELADDLVAFLVARLNAARPIHTPDDSWLKSDAASVSDLHTYEFDVEYLDGSRDAGLLRADGIGVLNDRYFYSPNSGVAGSAAENGSGDAPAAVIAPGVHNGPHQAAPAQSTVPAAPRVRPDTRAGHDINVTVNLDTGGPGITDVTSQLHDIVYTNRHDRPDGNPHRLSIALSDAADIPNRDFVLTWRQTADTVNEAVFVHADQRGGFFTLVLEPGTNAARAAGTESEPSLPRELVFVLDTSGSMGGEPIEKAKAVIAKAIDAMHAGDTFNLITFSGDTHILWESARPATPDNRQQAQAFLAERSGGGGTEMMQAIVKALAQPAPDPAAGAVRPLRVVMFLTDGQVGNDMAIIDAVQRHTEHTRVFSFGIGDSPNRFLLDGMARAGRGDVEYVQLNADADAAVARFARRIESPVLVDVSLSFSPGLVVSDMIPSRVPDLFDAEPIIVHGRYTQPGTGTLTIRGRTPAGAYERVIPVEFPAQTDRNDVVATLWARARVEALTNANLTSIQNGTADPAVREQIIGLGVEYQIMSQFTSFIAVEHQRVTVDGEPLLVPVPLETPHGQRWIDEAATIGTEQDISALNAWLEQSATPPPPMNAPGQLEDYLSTTRLRFSIQSPEAARAQSDGNGTDELRKMQTGASEARYGLVAERGQTPLVHTLTTSSDASPTTISRGRTADASGFVGLVAETRPTSAVSYAFQLPSDPDNYMLQAGEPVAGLREVSLGLAVTSAKPGLNFFGGQVPPAEAAIHRFGKQAAPDSTTGTPATPAATVAEALGRTLIVASTAPSTEPGQPELVPLSFELTEGRFVQPSTEESLVPAIQSPPPLPNIDLSVLVGDRPILFLPQRIILCVQHYTRMSRWADAAELARSLAAHEPGSALAQLLYDALTDPMLDETARCEAVEAIADAAAQEMTAYTSRLTRLAQRVETALLDCALSDGTVAPPASVRQTRGALLVTLLLQAPTDATFASLRHAGLSFDAGPKPEAVIAGTLQPDRLDDVALVDGVRRLRGVPVNSRKSR